MRRIESAVIQYRWVVFVFRAKKHPSSRPPKGPRSSERHEVRASLARGMQGFRVSAARHLNRAAKRSGNVFPDRYHATIIGSRRQARHALAYVLNNWRRHGEDRARYQTLPVWLPRTWLLSEGWRRYGLVRAREVPAPVLAQRSRA
jgi:hypothetical protein